MVAANAIYKFAVVGTVKGQQHIHTMHLRSTTHPDAVALGETAYQQRLIDDWQSACRTAYRAIFYTNDNPTESYQVRKVCGTLPLPAGVDEAETTGNIAGTRSSVSEPAAPWLSTVTTIRSGLAGRRYRGRNFLGGLEEQDIVGATVQSGRIGLQATYFSALMTLFVSPASGEPIGRWFVHSRLLAKQQGMQCQNAGADVTSYQNRSDLASMRSRKAGSGR